MTMGKCESWINQYKTNVILQKLIFTKVGEGVYLNPYFEITNDRIDSFFNMMNKNQGNLKSAIDSLDPAIWKEPILNATNDEGEHIRIFRDTSLPKDKNWETYKDLSPTLERYWNVNDDWKETAKHNTKKILKRVNFELNKNIHTRVLFNCIKFACIIKRDEKNPVERLTSTAAAAFSKTSTSAVTGSTPGKQGEKRPAENIPGSAQLDANQSVKKQKKKKNKVFYNYIKSCLKALYPKINQIYKKFNEMEDTVDKKLLYEVIIEILCEGERFDSAEIIKGICTRWFIWLETYAQ